MELSLIPQPHRVVTRRGALHLPPSGFIAIGDRSLLSAAQDATSLFPEWRLCSTAAGLKDTLRIGLNAKMRADGYRLTVGARGIALDAETPDAARHGIRTLAQIVSQSPAGTLPFVTVTDWPAFRDRGIYYDVTRGRVPHLDRLMQMAETLADHKINHLQLYIEHTFAFRGHPLIGKNASPLTAEDILRLDEFCARRGIELVPSLATFGHLSTVLKHRNYHELAEDRGIGLYEDPEAQAKKFAHRGWSLSPANPDVYTFLDSLFAEFLPLFRSRRFNVCCDETYDLGWGQSYEMCRRKGKGRVYLGHLRKLKGLAAKYGKHIMFWGDIVRHYPDLIPEIPRGVTVLDWGYSHSHPFNAIRDFRKAGFESFACPGTSSWRSLFPRLPEATANIRGFAAAAAKHGARGVLTTDWGDGGHYNFMELSWHGFLFAAEQSWNPGADSSTFTARFAKLFLRSDDKTLVRAIDRLGEISFLSVDGYYQSVWQHIFFALPDSDLFLPMARPAWVARNGNIRSSSVRLNVANGVRTIKELESIRRILAREARRGSTDPTRVLPYWIFAIDTTIHAARKLTVFGSGGRDTAASRKRLCRELERLMKRFEALWMARNRRSEIRITLRKYRRVLRALSRV